MRALNHIIDNILDDCDANDLMIAKHQQVLMEEDMSINKDVRAAPTTPKPAPKSEGKPDEEGINVTEVHFERLFNLGPFENFRIGFTATVGPTDTIDEVLIALDRETVRARKRFLTPVEPGKGV